MVKTLLHTALLPRPLLLLLLLLLLLHNKKSGIALSVVL
jgi:hypothetical protein